VPKGIAPYYYLRAPELLIKETDGQDCIRFHEKTFREYLLSSAIAYGMGAGISQDVYEGVKFLLGNYQGKLVLDADALNSISAYCDNYSALFENKKCEVVITPHAKEFARLCKKDIKTVLENGVQLAEEFAREYSVTVLLKGAVTLITDGERTALSAQGSAGQAKGGSGDVLSGLIASIAAQGNSLFDSACSAAYLCGFAAKLCEKELGEYSFTPTDVIAKIPFSILSLFQSDKTE
ncbi:MAG: NAD(P)H-hydrate dehydratase, partial [Clostridia bacterium]|nr:NAD(P)H-hydrate dehydratase [Clostridia bacterium]